MRAAAERRDCRNTRTDAEEQRRPDQQCGNTCYNQLREKYPMAQQELDRINDALHGLEFNGKRYRFSAPAERGNARHYHLIMGGRVARFGTALRQRFLSTAQESSMISTGN